MQTNDLLSGLFTLLFNNLYLNIFISVLCASSYLFNVVILRLRKQYLPLNNKMICLSLFIPLLNLSFLIFNVLIMLTYSNGFTIKRRRLTKSTYRYHKEKERRKKVAGASN